MPTFIKITQTYSETPFLIRAKIITAMTPNSYSYQKAGVQSKGVGTMIYYGRDGAVVAKETFEELEKLINGQ